MVLLKIVKWTKWLVITQLVRTAFINHYSSMQVPFLILNTCYFLKYIYYHYLALFSHSEIYIEDLQYTKHCSKHWA